jgi:HlyD family type I secretion membrane fusion protein
VSIRSLASSIASVGSVPSADTLYPRRCDRIARDAHALFLITVAGGLFGFLVWSASTTLDKVTRGSGRIIPVTQNQLVQHLEGGIVTEILVREGDTVERGQPLLRITNSLWEAELAQARLELKARKVKMTRLQAEIDGLATLAFPGELVNDVPQIVDAEANMFQTRKSALEQQAGILDDQVRQKELELAELKSRWQNTKRERDLITQQVESLRRLNKVGAVSRNDLVEAEIAFSQIEGKLSALVHDIPRTEAALSESERRRNEHKLRFRSDVEKEKTETELALAKLDEQITAMSDRVKRSEVVAPISGTVNKLFVTTLGGVVRPAEPLVQLVPADMSIAVEARVAPADRANVYPGQEAVVKISAYEYSLFGGIKGKVVEISSDALQDDKGNPYFRVRLEAQAQSFGPDKPVVPGMLAEVDILYGKHTVLEYLVKPIRDIQAAALRQ